MMVTYLMDTISYCSTKVKPVLDVEDDPDILFVIASSRSSSRLSLCVAVTFTKRKILEE
jgi:hypothetical protein